jgi:glycosidase
MLEKASKAELRDFPKGFHWMRCFENHDFANCKPGEKRKEELYGHKLNAAMIATCFMLNGIPMLYNGQEIADSSPHSIWSNRNHGKWCIDWSRSGDEAAVERLELIKRLTWLRHNHPGLFDAPVRWRRTTNPDKVYAFTRPLADGTVFTLMVNISGEEVEFALPDGKQRVLKPYCFELEESVAKAETTFSLDHPPETCARVIFGDGAGDDISMVKRFFQK